MPCPPDEFGTVTWFLVPRYPPGTGPLSPGQNWWADPAIITGLVTVVLLCTAAAAMIGRRGNLGAWAGLAVGALLACVGWNWLQTWYHDTAQSILGFSEEPVLAPQETWPPWWAAWWVDYAAVAALVLLAVLCAVAGAMIGRSKPASTTLGIDETGSVFGASRCDPTLNPGP